MPLRPASDGETLSPYSGLLFKVNGGSDHGDVDLHGLGELGSQIIYEAVGWLLSTACLRRPSILPN